MNLVSVLMPVYNVESYLRRSIESVLCQTYTSLELIIVDDGSTDNSLNICTQFAASDSRVKIFHHANQGISFTRNYALSKASGEYIAWGDSDDWIEPDMIELMVACAKEKDADIVSCKHETQGRVLCQQSGGAERLFHKGVRGNIIIDLCQDNPDNHQDLVYIML